MAAANGTLSRQRINTETQRLALARSVPSYSCAERLRTSRKTYRNKLADEQTCTRTAESTKFRPGQFQLHINNCIVLLLARRMGQYCFLHAGVCRCLSSSVTLPAGERAGCRARRQSCGRHSTAGQSCYVPLRRHLVLRHHHCHL